MRESGHRPLTERVMHDIAEKGAIRLGKLWLDKEDKGQISNKKWESTLHWSGSQNTIRLNPIETEILRLLMNVSNTDDKEGGIISTSELMQWFDDSRPANERDFTSENLIHRYISNLRKHLRVVTFGHVTIATEGSHHNARGYYLKVNEY